MFNSNAKQLSCGIYIPGMYRRSYNGAECFSLFQISKYRLFREDLLQVRTDPSGQWFEIGNNVKSEESASQIRQPWGLLNGHLLSAIEHFKRVQRIAAYVHQEDTAENVDVAASVNLNLDSFEQTLRLSFHTPRNTQTPSTLWYNVSWFP